MPSCHSQQKYYDLYYYMYNTCYYSLWQSCCTIVHSIILCVCFCFRPMTARTVVFYVTVGVHEFQQKLNVGVVINKDYKKLSCASLLLEVTYTAHLHVPTYHSENFVPPDPAVWSHARGYLSHAHYTQSAGPSTVLLHVAPCPPWI